MTVQYANKRYDYTHAKYWIVDEEDVWLSTGNWGSSDYPSGSTFPPYGQSGWQLVNRDLTVHIKDADMAKVRHRWRRVA